MASSPDLDRLRRETPGTAHGLHLNNAGASLPPTPVLEAVQGHLQAELEMGGYEAEWARSQAIEEAYRSMEGLLRATPGSVAFVENATVAFSQALSSIPFRPGDVILATRHDYVSNQLMMLTLAERFGVRVVHAPDGPDGRVDTGAMIELVHRLRPRLVTLTQVPTNSGIVQDAAPVAQAARFDTRGTYIRRWCPELGDLSDKALYAPWEHEEERRARAPGWPAEPIADLKASRERALAAYQRTSAAR